MPFPNPINEFDAENVAPPSILYCSDAVPVAEMLIVPSPAPLQLISVAISAVIVGPLVLLSVSVPAV